MDLGTLGVVAARIAGPKEAVTFVGLEAAGRIRSFRGWLEWDAPSFRVDSARPDRDRDRRRGAAARSAAGLRVPARRAARTDPQHAPGLAPAASAVPLTTSTIGSLILKTIGRPVGAP